MNVFSWNEGKDLKQQKFFTMNDKQYTVTAQLHIIQVINATATLLT